MAEENVHKDSRSQLRQKFIEEGLGNFDDYSVLEMLLFYSVSQKGTSETARCLLERFGSISEVFNAPISELIKVKGMSERSAVLLSLIPQLSRKYMLSKTNGLRICGVKEIAQFASSLFVGMTNEKFLLICVDDEMSMMNYNFISEGTVNHSIVDVRKIVGILLGSTATAAVIAHNHPRGNTNPSEDDLAVTVTIAKALKNIGVTLLDHVIVSADNYMSMAENPKEYMCYLNP